MAGLDSGYDAELVYDLVASLQLVVSPTVAPGAPRHTSAGPLPSGVARLAQSCGDCRLSAIQTGPPIALLRPSHGDREGL